MSKPVVPITVRDQLDAKIARLLADALVAAIRAEDGPARPAPLVDASLSRPAA